MSAIAGIYSFDQDPKDIEFGVRLMNALKKYPADDVQTWKDETVFLGCHAQWITPESIGEPLPYYDSESRLAITADAIIDNRKELFDLLQVENGRRAQIPDSQLILLAYRKWGEESPKYLLGDFAFMIWDERKQLLFGARDFTGSRTLYYTENKARFACCTTIEPLLQNATKELNEDWLAEYLAIGGMIDTVDAATTPYKGIEQLPPSHSISVSANKITLKRYCYLTPGEQLKLKTDDEYVEAFQEVFERAVTSRLRTHRNVGSQLSGGLDSGSVVGFAAKALRKENKTLHTFSYIPPKDFISFLNKRALPDERPYIQSTVRYVGGIEDHYLDFEGRDPYTEIDGFMDVLEMPYKFFENSFWSKGMFEKAHEHHMGVLLNGDRGNWTISWGIAEDYYGILLRKFKWIRLFRELDQYSKNAGGARLRRLPEIARLGFPVINRIFPDKGTFSMSRIINPQFAEHTGVFDKLKKHRIGDTGWVSGANIYEERRGLFEDLFSWNTGNTLNCKLSLKYGCWKRDPTNDLRVVRFCLSLPENQFVQNGLDRALIRRSTKHILPDDVRLNQRFKGVQGVDWVHRMRHHWGAFLHEAKQLLNDKDVLAFFDAGVLKTALMKAEKGPRPEMAIDADYKILMRSVILYRFLNTLKGGEKLEKRLEKTGLRGA